MELRKDKDNNLYTLKSLSGGKVEIKALNNYQPREKKMQENPTISLELYGARERKLLIELLTAWNEQGLPDGFDADEVTPQFNTNSGYVFLGNSDFQSAMIDDDGKLALWNYCGECGHEGFMEDCELNENGCSECNPV
jgi:hypothetical protein